MTEVGMALSCGLDNSDRVAESVGWPLPSVEVRLWETDEEACTGSVITPGEEILSCGLHKMVNLHSYSQDLFFFKASTYNLQTDIVAIHHWKIVRLPIPCIERITRSILWWYIIVQASHDFARRER
jgi:hypothetical protein